MSVCHSSQLQAPWDLSQSQRWHVGLLAFWACGTVDPASGNIGRLDVEYFGGNADG